MIKSAKTAYTCYQPVIEFTRGSLVESFHNGAVAVVDIEGRLVAFYGDPDVTSFLRSTAKPFIAIPFIESGALEKFNFTPKELAIICASHLGMDVHVETIRGMLKKIKLHEDNLKCGVMPVGDPETANRLIKEGEKNIPIRNCCSGKHTGMMAQALARGLSIDDYNEFEHPIQKIILETFAEMCGMEQKDVGIAIDGCSVPTFAIPLRKAAFAFARLADPRHKLPEQRMNALKKIFTSMNAYPDMVRGAGDFDTEVMRMNPGTLVSKSGAEAFFGLSIAPGVIKPNSPALGVAIKIGDGGTRADVIVAAEVLRIFGLLNKEKVDKLSELGWGPKKVLKNYNGIVVGEARPCFELKFT